MGQLVAVRRRGGHVVYALVHDQLVGGDGQTLLDVTVQSTRGPGIGGGRLRKVLPLEEVGQLPSHLLPSQSSARKKHRVAEKAALRLTRDTGTLTAHAAKESLLRQRITAYPVTLNPKP